MTSTTKLVAIETAQAAARRLTAKIGDLEVAYEYRDASGQVVFWNLRLLPKGFRMMSRNGNGYMLKRDDSRRPAKGWPLFGIETLNRPGPVIVCEGEKDVDAVAARGLPCVTSGSVTSDAGADWSPLQGRKALLWPDYDQPGKEFMRRIAEKLRPIAASVHIIDPATLGLPEKGDASDWLAKHPDAVAADVLALIPAATQKAANKPPEKPREDLEPDGWPEPMSEVAFYGIAGEFVRLVEPESEADRQALLVVFLVGFGCIVGRGPFYQIEATRHYVNLFVVLVGRTASGRKGTATDRAEEILQLVEPDFFRRKPGSNRSGRISGLSTGEGLIYAVRDAREEDVVIKEKNAPSRTERQLVDPGEPDKRLLVVEGEFVRVLQQSSRTGNSLSAIIRVAFDGKALEVAARSNKDRCEEPHIAILANITPDELRIELTTNDKANGFANRFLWIGCHRSKKLPYGGKPLDPAKKQALVERLQGILKTAKAIRKVELDPEAKEAWAPLYDTLTEDCDGLVGTMTARAAPLVLRLATVYALLDGSNMIRKHHLTAANEVWGYCEESVVYIFGDALGDETADAIRRMLSNEPDGMTQTEIRRAFSNHKSAAELARALTKLCDKGLIQSETEPTEGAPVTRWRIKPQAH